MIHKRTILLVEDNPDDIELTLLAFQYHQIEDEVVVVRDGIEALDYLLSTGDYRDRNPNELPRLILLDLQLPRMDGLALLDQLRQHEKTKCLPIVILSNSNERQDLLNSYNRGCNSYIQKPVDFNQFLAVLNQINQYWLIYNYPPPVPINSDLK